MEGYFADYDGIITTPEDFARLTEIDKVFLYFINHLFVPGKDFVIAGGAVRSFLCSEPFKDIDVFILNSKVWTTIKDDVSLTDSIASGDGLSGGKLYVRGVETPIDIILEFNANVEIEATEESLYERFDIVNAQMSFQPEGVFMTFAAMSAWTCNMISINRNRKQQDARLAKYHAAKEKMFTALSNIDFTEV